LTRSLRPPAPGQKQAATSRQWNQRSANASSPAKLFGGTGMLAATDGRRTADMEAHLSARKRAGKGFVPPPVANGACLRDKLPAAIHFAARVLLVSCSPVSPTPEPFQPPRPASGPEQSWERAFLARGAEIILADHPSCGQGNCCKPLSHRALLSAPPPCGLPKQRQLPSKTKVSPFGNRTIARTGEQTVAKQPKGELVVIGFNYDLLETKLADKVRNAADRIRDRIKKTVEDIIEVGTTCWPSRRPCRTASSCRGCGPSLAGVSVRPRTS
jgi:hypothetical protein